MAPNRRDVTATLGIRTKQILGIGVILALLLGIGASGAFTINLLLSRLDALSDVNTSASLLGKANNALWELRYATPNFIVYSDAERRKRIVENEKKWPKIVTQYMDAYAAGNRTAEERKLYGDFKKIFDEYIPNRPTWFELQGSGKIEEAAAYRDKSMTPFGSATTKAFDALLAEQEKIGKAQDMAMDNLRAQVRMMLWALGALTALAVAIGLGSAYVLAIRMPRQLREVTGSLGESGSQVRTASEQLSSASGQLSSLSSQASTTLQGTMTSLKHLSGIITENSELSANADSLSQQANSAAKEGEQSMQRLGAAMGEIAVSSKKVTDIIAVIDNLSFQTNLLALNAAVEAARAGDQGKGFAVVAEEVRNLALRSANAAKEINQLIQESAMRVKHGEEIARANSAVLTNIVRFVTEVSSINAKIAGSSKAQTEEVNRINLSVNDLDQVTLNNAAAAEEAASFSEELARQAQDLYTLVDSLQRIVEGGSQSNGAPALALQEYRGTADDPRMGG